jgi:hypothetical protein
MDGSQLASISFNTISATDQLLLLGIGAPKRPLATKDRQALSHEQTANVDSIH